MKKVFLALIVVLSIFIMPHLAIAADGLVPCGKGLDPNNPDPSKMCQLVHLGAIALGFYRFIVYTIALPLAGLFIVLGGILLLVSAGNPALSSIAKNMLKYSIIGILLVFGSYLIIDVVLKTIGYTLEFNKF